MGDRVLFQVVGPKPPKGEKRRISPVVYGHWAGDRAPEIFRNLKARMESRGADVEYTAARLVQEVTNGDTGNLSCGMWNAPKKLTEKDSHGDAGCVVISWDDKGMTFECFGGYLKKDLDGLPYVGD